MSQTTPVVKSKVIWGGLLAFLPFLYEQLPEIIGNVLPILPPQVGGILQAIGGLLAIFGRYNPDIKPIKR